MSYIDRYNPAVVAANGTYQIVRNSIGGFICTTTGTLTLAANASDGKPAFTILTAFPVTAGETYFWPLYLGTNGGTLTLAGGAAGVLMT